MIDEILQRVVAYDFNWKLFAMMLVVTLPLTFISPQPKPVRVPYSRYLLYPEVDYCAKVKIVKGQAYQDCFKRFKDGSTYHRSGV